MIIEFWAEGFEDVEAITPVDMLKRAGKEVVTVSINEKREVVSAHGITFTADKTIDFLDGAKNVEAVILPGGMPGAKNLRGSKEVCDFVLSTYKSEKLVCAICAAPFILGELGILNGRSATCYPGFEDKLLGADVKKARDGYAVVTDGNVITAAGMGAALDFSDAIILCLCGEEKVNEIDCSIIR